MAISAAVIASEIVPGRASRHHDERRILPERTRNPALTSAYGVHFALGDVAAFRFENVFDRVSSVMMCSRRSDVHFARRAPPASSDLPLRQSQSQG